MGKALTQKTTVDSSPDFWCFGGGPAIFSNTRIINCGRIDRRLTMPTSLFNWNLGLPARPLLHSANSSATFPVRNESSSFLSCLSQLDSHSLPSGY